MDRVAEIKERRQQARKELKDQTKLLKAALRKQKKLKQAARHSLALYTPQHKLVL